SSAFISCDTPTTYTLSLHDALPISRDGTHGPIRKCSELRRRPGRLAARWPSNRRCPDETGVPAKDTANERLQRELAAESRWSLRSEEHTSELQSRVDLVCRLLLEKK